MSKDPSPEALAASITIGRADLFALPIWPATGAVTAGQRFRHLHPGAPAQLPWMIAEAIAKSGFEVTWRW